MGGAPIGKERGREALRGGSESTLALDLLHRRLRLAAIDVGDSFVRVSIVWTCLEGPGDIFSLAYCSQKLTRLVLSKMLTPRCLFAKLWLPSIS